MFVQAIGLGAMPLSIQGRPDESNALAVIEAALDAGTDFFDTADAYCLDESERGHNERLLAKALRKCGRRSDTWVATKGGCIRPEGRWGVDGRREHLRFACEESLRALDVEEIFLYQLHAPDPKVPFEESVGALAELQREGKIRYLGLSNVTPEQLKEALRIARIETVQNRCNPFEQRDLSRGMLSLCKEHGISFLPHSPVGGHFRHREVAQHPVLQRIAKGHGASPYTVMLAWHLALGPHVIPIPGASKRESAVDSARAITLKLSREELEEITALGRG